MTWGSVLNSVIGGASEPEEPRSYGITIATVLNNVDLEHDLARVQVQLRGMALDPAPWARVAVPQAGNELGVYFLPQVNDEVLVAFRHGDPREVYIIGSLWNGVDRPPSASPTDARTKRLIRTPAGHELLFDDQAKALTVTSASRHQVKLSPSKIEITTAGDTASITLEKTGAVSIKARQRIELDAPTIQIQGKTVDIGGSAAARIDGGQVCYIQAGSVFIN